VTTTETVETDQDETDEESGDGEDDPCNYYGQNVCDQNGKCDSDRFDCLTDCDDGSSVTTGESCPGQNNDRDMDNDSGDETGEEEEESSCQPEDDYCDISEDCHLESVDCIDDVNIGDDGEDSTTDEEDDNDDDSGDSDSEGSSNEDNLFG
jgi:hypothetical protein